MGATLHPPAFSFNVKTCQIISALVNIKIGMQCKTCKYEFSPVKNLRKHFGIGHEATLNSLRMWNLYKPCFRNLKKHKFGCLCISNYAIQCKTCKYEFSTTKNLPKHLRSDHAEEQVLTFKICISEVSDYINLKKHKGGHCCISKYTMAKIHSKT